MRILLATLLLCSSALGFADSGQIASSYAVIPNATYLTADGVDLKLDVYLPWSSVNSETKPKLKTVIFYHGGGWVAGSKEASQLGVVPYLDKGWAAVNVQYRLGGTALAPAAVEDARCALRWVINNTDRYGFDTDKIVLTGRSAGGHLSLITGMLPADAGLDSRCPVRKGGTGADRAAGSLPNMRVAAIVNWSGITDVNDLIAGPNITSYAVAWLGAQTDREDIARRVSPLTHVDSDVPPILTIHGDEDVIVPYEHAVRLHAALDDAGADNELLTLEGREHFVDYTPEDNRTAYDAINAFLDEHVK